MHPFIRSLLRLRVRLRGAIDQQKIKRHWAATSAIVLGVAVSLAFLFVPLDTVVYLEGDIEVEGNNYVVSSEGPQRLKRVLVSDGDEIQEGQTLLEFDSTSIDLEWTAASAGFESARRAWARLALEVGVDENVTSIEALFLEINSATSLSLKDQRVSNSRIAQARAELERLQSDRQAVIDQLERSTKELQMAERLDASGFVTKNQLFSAQNVVSDLRARLSGLNSQSNQVSERIRELQIETGVTGAERMTRVTEELSRVYSARVEAQRRLRAAERLKEQALISSGVDGVVLIPNPLSEGMIVSSGVKLIEVVPRNSKLRLRAGLSRQESLYVRSGMRARLRVVGASASLTKFVEASVASITPDSMKNADTGEKNYSVVVAFDAEEFRTIYGENLKPGLLCSLEIVGQPRSIFNQFMSPLITAIRGARFH